MSGAHDRVYCWQHETLAPAGAPCPQCVAEGNSQPQLRTVFDTLPRDVLGILEARIADLEATVLRLDQMVRHAGLKP